MANSLDGIGKRSRKCPRKKTNWQIPIILGILGLLIVGFLLIFSAAKNELAVLRLFRSGKYLIIFQNNSELRPTGGFIGSFAVATFSGYRLKNIGFDTNIYKLDKSYVADHNIPPPGPLATITERWALRDSNWAISYPESANQIEWFYREETGEDLDGVIAVNASVVRDILKIIGPVDLPKYQTTINYDNFFTELTTQIEKDYFTSGANKLENEPKAILQDLMPQVLGKIKTCKLKVFKLAYQEILQKQILFYANNSRIENGILAKNWGGEVQKTSFDYLLVNQASIVDVLRVPKVGGKSSVSVDEKIDYEVTKKNDKLIGNLTVTRTHHGSYTWPDGTNHNWTRVLVPEGSVMQTATMDGKDIKEAIATDIESGKTTFGFWTKTAPKTSTAVNLVYTLPILEKNYSLLVQKQPGNLGDALKVTFENKVLFNGTLDTDKIIK